MSLAPAMTLHFSIVVPTLDRKEMLLSAIKSIRAQNWPDLEIIVVDGGSSDGTIEEIATHSDICLLRGPDKGVYDAFNKGIARAGGDIVGILNSDDLYEPGAFSAVAAAFAAHPGAHAVCGSTILADNDRTVYVFDREVDKSLLSPRTSLIGSCITNARFSRRTAMGRIGPFSTTYRYVSDRDWLTRWHEAGLRTVAIPQCVYRYRQHAGSLTFDRDRRRELAIREELLKLARYWRNNQLATPETRRVARLLEGRCVAFLAARALRHRRLNDFAHWLLATERGPSADPMLSVVRGGADWIMQELTRRTSRPSRKK
jgi:glycosyltransferase involved in cell wall biosynthesis